MLTRRNKNIERKNSIVRKDGLNLKSVVFKKGNGKQCGNGKRKTGRAKVAHSFVERSLTRELALQLQVTIGHLDFRTAHKAHPKLLRRKGPMGTSVNRRADRQQGYYT